MRRVNSIVVYLLLLDLNLFLSKKLKNVWSYWLIGLYKIRLCLTTHPNNNALGQVWPDEKKNIIKEWQWHNGNMDRVQVTPRVTRPIPIKTEDDPLGPRKMGLLGWDMLCCGMKFVVVRCGPLWVLLHWRRVVYVPARARTFKSLRS